jgi:hypothetical protein
MPDDTAPPSGGDVEFMANTFHGGASPSNPFRESIHSIKVKIGQPGKEVPVLNLEAADECRAPAHVRVRILAELFKQMSIELEGAASSLLARRIPPQTGIQVSVEGGTKLGERRLHIG